MAKRGEIRRFFNANDGSTVNISGGTFDDFFWANDGSTINIMGGTGNRFFRANSGSTVNIRGGTVGDSFHAHPGSAVTVSGGSFGNGFFAHSGSTVIIEGGDIGENFTALPGSLVQVSGGTFSRDFGTAIGSNVELIGGEYKLNGAEFTNATITLAPGDVFTGTLANGTPFVFSPLDQDALSGVTLVPTPLSGPDTTPMVINIAGSAPLGLRSGQLLTLQEGGVLDRNFSVVNATLLVEGGVVGHGLEVVDSIVNITGGDVKANLNAYAGSTINISGGKVGENSWKSADRIDAYAGSIINISGGEVIGRIRANSESTINITGGEVEDRIEASTDATVNISGGTVDRSLRARAGSTINVSGGNFTGERMYVGFSAFVGSEINLFGTEFVLDEVPLELELGVPLTIITRDVTLSGLFADGSPFSFDLYSQAELGDWFQSGATLTVNVVSGVVGDFNGDSEVDGADFLAWQRGESPDPHTISDLDAWQENYGVGGANLAAETAVIPEPWSGSLLFVAVVVLAMGYREPRSDFARLAQ